MSEWESILQSLSSLGSMDGIEEGCLGLLLSSKGILLRFLWSVTPLVKPRIHSQKEVV